MTALVFDLWGLKGATIFVIFTDTILISVILSKVFIGYQLNLMESWAIGQGRNFEMLRYICLVCLSVCLILSQLFFLQYHPWPSVYSLVYGILLALIRLSIDEILLASDLLFEGQWRSLEVKEN